MSQIGKNTTFGPFAVRYFPFSHCQKSLIYSYLIYKNAATLITVSIRKKRPLRLIAVRVFSLYALSKNFNQLFPSSKTPQHQAICSQTGKNATSRQLCRAVCSLHTLSKTFRPLFSQFKKRRNISLSVRNQKKTHCQAPAPTCLFPSILLKICLL